jgi:hypothetical protein
MYDICIYDKDYVIPILFAVVPIVAWRMGWLSNSTPLQSPPKPKRNSRVFLLSGPSYATDFFFFVVHCSSAFHSLSKSKEVDSGVQEGEGFKRETAQAILARCVRRLAILIMKS